MRTFHSELKFQLYKLKSNLLFKYKITIQQIVTYILSIVLILVLCSCNQSRNSHTEETSIEDIAFITTEEIYKTTLELYLDSLGLIEVNTLIPNIKIELKYAGIDNFTKKVLYKNLNRAYLHPIAAEKLSKAQILLQEHDSLLFLLIYDAVRPLSIQKEMFESVKNTKYRAYVADPSRTGLHNYGLAVDITICDSLVNPLDMGTEFDYFGQLAGINNEDSFIQQGLLSKKQVANRRLLRNVMKKAGFIPIRGEWWHFNALPLSEAKRQAILIK